LYNTVGPSPVSETHVLFDDVLVIAVGATSLTPVQPTGEATAASNQNATLVTLALKPDQAPRLVRAVNTQEVQYPLYAGLRGADVNIDTALVVTAANIFNH
jgi:hypothetical protein